MARSAKGWLRLAGASSGIVIGLVSATPGHAQQSNAQQTSEGSADDIVVTAQFREQPLQDTPIAITAVTSAMMEARSQTTLADVVKQAPNVQLLPATAGFGPSVSASIRGLGQADFNPAMEPGVGLYIDDVYYPRLTGANFDLLDVERVEILRGPQGTLTGRNSEGGAIKFISAQPTGSGGGFAQATYGSRNRINLRAAADFKLSDNLFARFSGAFADQKGYVQNLDFGCANPGGGEPVVQPASTCVKATHGDVGYRAIRASLRYVPNDQIDLRLTGDYVKDVRNQSAEVLVYADNPNPSVATQAGTPFDSRFICGRYCNYATYGTFAGPFKGPIATGYPLSAVSGDPRTSYEGWGLSSHLTVKASDTIAITSITAYRRWNSQFSVDGDLSPAVVNFGLNDLKDWFFSQELRANVIISDGIEATIGGYYSRENTVYWTLQDIRYAAIPLQFANSDPVNTNSKAVFGTLILRPTQKLTLTAGGRYTGEHKDYTFSRYNPDGTTPNAFLGGLNGTTAIFEGERFDYRLSADYRFSEQILAYVNLATGFKGGGVGPRPFNVAQARAFAPEKVTTYELGVKTDLLDRRVRFNVSACLNEFKDAQLALLSCPQFGGPGPCALPQNAGNARQTGFEMELQARPVEGLLIDGSLSYLDWKWKCVNPAVVGAAAGPCSSDRSVLGALVDPASGWKWAFGIQYQADVGSIGTITPRIDVTRQPELPNGALQPAVNSPSAVFGRVEGYTLANARVTWALKGGDASVSLEVTNLFDRYYFINKFDVTGAGAGVISGQPGRPREWAITVKKSF